MLPIYNRQQLMLRCTKSFLNYYRRDLVPSALFLSTSINILEGIHSAGGTNSSLKYSRQDLMTLGTKSCLNYCWSNLVPGALNLAITTVGSMKWQGKIMRFTCMVSCHSSNNVVELYPSLVAYYAPRLQTSHL